VVAQPTFPSSDVDGPRQCKTMSAIRYQRDYKGRWVKRDWGAIAYRNYQAVAPAARANFVLIDDFKLALADDVQRERFLARLPAGCSDLTAERVMADFIACIKEDALKALQEQYKPAKVEASQVTWTITVPASWGYKRQLQMREAAVTAGLAPDRCVCRAGSRFAQWAIRNLLSPTYRCHPQLNVISEPEAAALSCVTTDNLKLDQGCVFMVVDAGGATTDITVHTVEEGDHLMEAVATRGLLAGSKLVDQNFEAWLRT
jgi:hypothetical protein